MLLELVRLRGGLQKGRALYLALEYRVCDIVAKKEILGHTEIETNKVY
jgi:hypothetical protein